MEMIDFILTWVDGKDPEWLTEKRKWEAQFKGQMNVGANKENRYRSDDELLRYWFRSVENYAPWVNKIHFVTCGQKPYWLDENHPKLNLLNHVDFIPSKYLPTFNSNTIEMNLHRIEGVSERYVLFNDDMFLLRPVGQDFFFREGNPVLKTDLRYTKDVGYNHWSRVIFNDYCLVNRSFDARKSIWNNRNKWFNIKELGLKRVRQNLLCYLANKTVPVHTYGHVAFPHLKSTLEEVWRIWPDVMDFMSSHKFRSDDQVNQWVLCAWNQAKGTFYPTHEIGIGRFFEMTEESLSWICETIKSQCVPQICVNDTENDGSSYERSVREINNAYRSILPERSSFEKG